MSTGVAGPTTAQTSYAELLAWLQFAPTEMEALSGIPLQGYEAGLFVGLPMLACLGVILAGGILATEDVQRPEGPKTPAEPAVRFGTTGQVGQALRGHRLELETGQFGARAFPSQQELRRPSRQESRAAPWPKVR
jgi:hypothetical protein